MDPYTPQTTASRIARLQATPGSFYRRGEICPLCRQPITDIRHGHPHDYSGSADDMLNRKPCLSCNKPH